MTRRAGRIGLRVRGLVVCAACVVALCDRNGVRAEDNGGPSLMRRLADSVDRSLVSRCLTPAAGTAMSQVAASGALQPILGNDLTLKRGNVGADTIEIEIEDPSHQASVLTLALPGTRTEEPTERGTHFWFYLASSNPPNPRMQQSLLAMAKLFDAAIPETALAPCSGSNQPKEDPRYPRSIALGSAVAEVLIIIIAVLYGLRAIKRWEGAPPGEPPRTT